MNISRHFRFDFLLLVLALTGVGRSATAADPLEVASPDGNIAITFELKSLPQPYLPGQRAYYRVSYKGTQILTDSPLGLDFYASTTLDQNLEIVTSNRRSNTATWENRFGTKRTVPDNYNELTVSLRERNAPGRRVDIVFRAYNEGVAFRYVLPRQDALGKFSLASEDTGFNFASDVSAYALNMGRFNTHNEAEFERVGLSQIKPSSIVPGD
jgi:alpha-glucosidase